MKLLATLLLLASLQIGSTAHSVLVDSSLAQNSSPASRIDHQHKSGHSLFSLRNRVAKRRNDRRKNGVWHASLLSTGTVKKIPIVQQPIIFPVFDQPDIRLKHRLIATEAIMSLPPQCRNQLQNFFVRYDNPENRGLGGKTTIILDGGVPDDEFRALFLHEYTHVMDLGCLTGTPASGPTAFIDGPETMYRDDPSVQFYSISWLKSDQKKHGTHESDFVSGYAAWDAYEDMAESVTYYILQQDAFRQRAQTNKAIAAKLAWIEMYAFPQGLNVAKGKHQWTGKVPWDITKLPYEWKSNTGIAFQ